MIDKAIFSLPGIKRVLLLLAGFVFLRAVAIIGQAWSLASAITNLWYGEQLANQLFLISLFFICFVGKQGILYLQDSVLDHYAFEQADTLRQSLLEKIFTTKAQLVQDNGTGSVTAAVLEGIDQVETYFRLILPKITSIVVIPMLLVVVVFSLDWVSGLIMLIAFPFIILYMKILGLTAKAKAAKQHRTFQIMSNHFIDTLRGIDTLKLFGVSKQRGESIYHVSERFREATMKTLAVANLSSVVLDLFSTLSIAAVAFMLGMRLLDGSLLLFPAMAILVIAPEYFKPIREFASDYHASLDGKNALAQVRALIATPEEPIEEHDLAQWSDGSTLNLCGIGCSLSGSRVLRNVTLDAHGFQKIGIVGMSGAGKSTLINM
ncbi:MAG: ABC transporter transmembrane domain-containing protein, partial [Raoultibacter sp.]